MSYDNENSPITTVIHLGSLSGDLALPGVHFPRKAVLIGVHLLNGAEIPADNDEFLVMYLKLGSTIYAQIDTREAGQGAVDDFVGKALELLETIIPAGSTLHVNYDENEGQPEITKVICVAATELDGKTFILHDEDGSVAFWVDVDNSGTSEPAAAGAEDRAVEVTTVTNAMTAAQVAAVLATKINADSKFTAIVDPEDDESVLVTVDTHADVEDAADSENVAAEAEDGTVAATAEDANTTLHEKYFVLADEVGTVAFWMDVGGGGSEPSHGADRSVEITTILAGETAAQVAAKLVTAINADSKFTAVINADPTKVDWAVVAPGAVSGQGNGNSGFTVAVVNQGVNEILNETGFTFETIQQGVNPVGVELTNAKLALSYFVP
jgi:hypothetical protein